MGALDSAPWSGNRFEGVSGSGPCPPGIDVQKNTLKDFTWKKINAEEFEFLNTKKAKPSYDDRGIPNSYCYSIAEGNRFKGLTNGDARCAPSAAYNKEECAKKITDFVARNRINEEEKKFLLANGLHGSLPNFNAENIAVHLCPCGCFDPTTRLYIFDQTKNLNEWKPIQDIVMDVQKYSIWSLGEESSVLAPTLAKQGIAKFTYGPETKPLVLIHTQSGQKLAITPDHAVLLIDGRMVAAETLKLGQLMVSDKGVPDEVVKISERTIQGDVLNVLTSGKSYLSHLVLAEGLIVGDLIWQNSLKSELNSVILRQ
ncbi:MAG: Hint domain-containing protein [Myxococcaceae bacterium]